MLAVFACFQNKADLDIRTAPTITKIPHVLCALNSPVLFARKD